MLEIIALCLRAAGALAIFVFCVFYLFRLIDKRR